MNEYSATFNSKPSKSTNGTANATPENNVISRFIKRDTCFSLFISSAFLINKKVSTLTENINAKSMLAANKSNILFITSIVCELPTHAKGDGMGFGGHRLT